MVDMILSFGLELSGAMEGLSGAVLQLLRTLRLADVEPFLAEVDRTRGVLRRWTDLGVGLSALEALDPAMAPALTRTLQGVSQSLAGLAIYPHDPLARRIRSRLESLGEALRASLDVPVPSAD